mmetsp:Transcript_4864/g.4739  ORF Transcript_4864/g.4739 Transcript_4864/m.4739 type:complete len:290 (-) Transcript_4864:25-894(-)
MSYFRAVLQSQEVSERAFRLTTETVNVSPGFYTAWHYRRFLLDKLNISIVDELNFLTELASNHPKNYQIWYYRRELMNRLQNPSSELEFVNMMLEIDEKNIHAWGYRQWVIQKFNLWEDELKFTDELIQRDPRNNSAWSERYFVISKTENLNDSEVRMREINYALKSVEEIPTNESAWNYIRGLYVEELSDEIKKVMIKIIENKGYNVYLLQCLEFIYNKQRKGDLETVVCKLLQSVDYIRKSYWRWRETSAKGKNLSRSAIDLQLIPMLIPKQPFPSVMALYYGQALR